MKRSSLVVLLFSIGFLFMLISSIDITGAVVGVSFGGFNFFVGFIFTLVGFVLLVFGSDKKPDLAEITRREFQKGIQDLKSRPNLAQKTLNKDAVPTSPRELKQIATGSGYVLDEGPKHTDVYWLSSVGKKIKITEIPRHGTIKRGTARGVLKDMATGYGRYSGVNYL